MPRAPASVTCGEYNCREFGVPACTRTGLPLGSPASCTARVRPSGVLIRCSIGHSAHPPSHLASRHRRALAPKPALPGWARLPGDDAGDPALPRLPRPPRQGNGNWSARGQGPEVVGCAVVGPLQDLGAGGGALAGDAEQQPAVVVLDLVLAAARGDELPEVIRGA